MKTACIDDIKKWLRENLTDEKYFHSLGTAQAAREIAKKYEYDEEKAYLTGLLHDCAKCLPKEKMLELLDGSEIILEDGESENTKVLHAPAGAVLAKEIFEVKNEEILNAIRWHTLGNLNMTMLEKIVFLADKIEPETRGRNAYEQRILSLNEVNGLEKNILACYSYTIKSLVDRELTICSKTVEIYNELLKFLK